MEAFGYAYISECNLHESFNIGSDGFVDESSLGEGVKRIWGIIKKAILWIIKKLKDCVNMIKNFFKKSNDSKMENDIDEEIHGSNKSNTLRIGATKSQETHDIGENVDPDSNDRGLSRANHDNNNNTQKDVVSKSIIRNSSIQDILSKWMPEVYLDSAVYRIESFPSSWSTFMWGSVDKELIDFTNYSLEKALKSIDYIKGDDGKSDNDILEEYKQDFDESIKDGTENRNSIIATLFETKYENAEEIAKDFNKGKKLIITRSSYNEDLTPKSISIDKSAIENICRTLVTAKDTMHQNNKMQQKTLDKYDRRINKMNEMLKSIEKAEREYNDPIYGKLASLYNAYISKATSLYQSISTAETVACATRIDMSRQMISERLRILRTFKTRAAEQYGAA